MNYVFLANNYRGYKEYFSDLINKGFAPITLLFPHEKKAMYLKNEIVIKMDDIINSNRSSNIDYEFILEYYFKRYNKNINAVMNNIFPKVQFLFTKLMPIIQPGDIVISGNSGEWISRLVHEICVFKKAKFFYFENFFFKDMYQISSVPFTYSVKYGKPELFIRFSLLSGFHDEDVEFLNNYLLCKNSKYEQNNCFFPKDRYDYFVVGQMPYDTNVIIPVSIYHNAEDLCFNMAIKSDKKFIYKPHPLADVKTLEYYKKIQSLENVTITNASIFDIFECTDKILTISSTVGIEAQLRGLNVEWCSNTVYADFKLNEEINRYLFINACRNYMFPLNKLYDEIIKRSGNYGENKKLSI